MKKLLSLVLVVMMLLSASSVGAFASTVPSGWAWNEVVSAENAGIITDAVKRDYQKNITREQFCELVVKLYEKLTNKKATASGNVFIDTNNQEILKAYNLGIVKGISSNQFAPYNNITRQEICVMLVRCIDVAVNNENIKSFNDNSFADKYKIAAWAIDYVNYAYDNGILKGIGYNYIDPLGNTTCEQAILLAYRIYSKYYVQDDSVNNVDTKQEEKKTDDIDIKQEEEKNDDVESKKDEPTEETGTNKNTGVKSSYNGNEYSFFEKNMTYTEAKKFCENMGGHLATISSKGENEFLFNLMRSYGYDGAYFGFTDAEAEGTWKWVNGESVSYTNWHPGEPNAENENEDYAMFYYKFDDGTWNDGDFSGRISDGKRVFICEWDGTVKKASNEYNGHRYMIFNNAMTYSEAKKFCESMGGYLATISSEGENEFLFNFMKSRGYDSAYFGFSDEEVEGEWKWANGEKVSYTNWHPGEPNAENEHEDYAMFYYKFDDGTWNDGDFGGSTLNGGTAFICEQD